MKCWLSSNNNSDAARKIFKVVLSVIEIDILSRHSGDSVHYSGRFKGCMLDYDIDVRLIVIMVYR